MKQLTICTYCGEVKPVTRDHVIPACLFFGSSNDRSIKMPSCGDCNWKSEEGLLKTFFAMFDERITVSRAREVAHPKSRGDLQAFLSATPDLKLIYPEERVTKLLKKMLLGLRRHQLRDKGTFAPRESLSLFAGAREGDKLVFRLLPLKVGGPNPGHVLPAELEEFLNHASHQFRDFSFGMDPAGSIILRYNRSFMGNELLLVGYVEEAECGA